MTTRSFAADRLRLTIGRVARITINAPERRNAISHAMWAALPEVCRTLDADDSVRAVLLTATGAAFSAGADITEFGEVYASAASSAAYTADVRAAQAALHDLPRPVIAVITGACVGGACGLVLACDLRFAAPEARFGITAARLGLAYSYEDTAQLVAKVGPARAKDILFSARLIPAAEALDIGLIDRVVPAAALDTVAQSYAEGLAELSPLSIRAAKATINALSAPPPDPPRDVRALFDALFDSADFTEGRTAFLERRPPRF